jgi:protein DGCR14
MAATHLLTFEPNSAITTRGPLATMASPPSIQALALVKRTTESSLIPAPPPAKRQKRPPKQLAEEDYTEALQQIIERDFYPSLADMRKQTAYFDALKEGNPVHIAEAERALLTTDEAPPKGEDEGEAENKAREMREDVRGLKLDAFQAKYTSEDNESFNALLDSENAANREKYAWQYAQNRKLTKQQLQLEHRKILLLAAGKKPHAAGEQNPEDEDERWSKGLEMWKWTPNNVLMNPHPGLEDQPDPTAGKKQIRHLNTRVPSPPPRQPGPTPLPSPSPSTVEAALSGRANTPKVNGYNFVSTPRPTDLGAPQMTWGTLSSVPPSPFRVPDVPARDKLGRKLAEKAEKSMTARQRSFTPLKSRLGGTVATPKFASSPDVRRLGLTPAGQRLWEGSLQGRRVLRGDAGRESPQVSGGSVVGRTPLMRTPRLAEGGTPLGKK